MEHNFFLDNETVIRLRVFLGILALMAILESVLPRRSLANQQLGFAEYD